MTKGEFVSIIVNSLRKLNKDSHISKRFILSIAESKSKFYLAQKIGAKSLALEENVLSVIECFPMKKVDVIKCANVEIRNCKDLMKSEERLPELLYNKLGDSVLSVSTIDGGKFFTKTSMRKYLNQKRRKFFSNIGESYYYVEDGYLYLPDSTIKVVNVTLLTLDKERVEELSSCGGVREIGMKSSSKRCKSVWEEEFVCSEKYLEVVRQEVLNEVLQSYERIVIDENPNLDSNIKSTTVK